MRDQRKYPRVLSTLVAIVMVSALLPISQAMGFWMYDSPTDYTAVNTQPDASMRYNYFPSSSWRHWAPGSGERDRMYSAAKLQWNDRVGADAGFTMYLSGNTTNYVGWWHSWELGVPAPLASATVGCDSEWQGCLIKVNEAVAWHKTNDGQVPNQYYYPLSGVLSHEIGHWFAHRDCNNVPEDGPDGEMKTMCYSSGWRDRHEQLVLTQSEFQGTRFVYDELEDDELQFAVNTDFDICASSSGTCVPTFWDYKADSNRHWWWTSGGNGFFSVNDGVIKYPEIIHHAWGPDVNDDGNEKWRVDVRLYGYDEGPQNTRAVLFARWEDNSYEAKCDLWPNGMPTGVWIEFGCVLTVGQHAYNTKWEFGVRSTDKIKVDWMTVQDV